MKLLYNEKFSCIRTGLSNFEITRALAKLDLVCSRLVSNGLIFSNIILVDIQLVTSLLLSTVGGLSTGGKN